jgi:hypothetical protein
MAMPPNLREEPQTKRTKNTDRPSLGETQCPASKVIEFAKKEELAEESPLPRTTSDHAARCRIGAAGAGLLGCDFRTKLPDGRHMDQAFLDALPEPLKASLIAQSRKGTLRRSHLAEAILSLGIAARLASAQAAA